MRDQLANLLNGAPSLSKLTSHTLETFGRSGLNEFRREVEELLAIFPDCDPFYLQHCCKQYRDNHVARVCEKIFQLNFSNYPVLPRTLVTQAYSSAAKNIYLEKLSEMFSDCDATYLRETISRYSHTVIYKATDHLLKLSGNYPKRPHFGRLEVGDYFRSEPYMLGAFYRLLNQFPKISKSTVKATLAEANYNFLESYRRLSELTPRQIWGFTVLGFNTRKVYDEPCMYTLELLLELNRNIAQVNDTSLQDHEVAMELNQRQYDEENQGITCGCCYLQFPFEALAQCDDGHLFCQGCVNRYVSEAIHGQSGLKGDTCVPCMDTGGCNSYFFAAELERVLEPSLLASYNRFVVERELERSSLALARCPFCTYVEADQDPSLRKVRRLNFCMLPFILAIFRSAPDAWRYFWWVLVPAHLLCFALSALVVFEVASKDLLSYLPSRYVPSFLISPMAITMLQCRSPECGKLSCRICFQQCLPSHRCLEDERDALRLKVEQAMADAVKRTCPECNLSFTKYDGCNKMTCRCGYVMCYLCRQGIKAVSYAHFCEHFRFNPGEACNQCSKCDLYRNPNDDAAISNAARQATRAFLAEHPELTTQLRAKAALVSLDRGQAQWIGNPEDSETLLMAVKDLAISLKTAFLNLFLY